MTTKSRADRAAALRAAVQADATPPPPAPVAPAPATGKPVRQTVDLLTADHLRFAAWRMETAVSLGRSRLTTQDALAGLVALLLEDETVARRARTKIAEVLAAKDAGDT